MHKLTRLRKWLPVIWVGLAAVILAADFSAGPLISLSILFLVPVVLAARLSGGWWAVGLGVLMPLAHLGFTFLWKVNRPLADSVINDGIRMVVLVAVAVLMARMTRQEREIRVLRGLLPVCAFCKKIRTEDQRWQPIESYITERSEASFTHTFCPECGKAHYGELYDQIAARQSPAPRDKPKGAA